jgi:hypothetical protein
MPENSKIKFKIQNRKCIPFLINFTIILKKKRRKRNYFTEGNEANKNLSRGCASCGEISNDRELSDTGVDPSPHRGDHDQGKKLFCNVESKG